MAPLSLPRNSASSTRRSWRPMRQARTASSLPIVVGVAGWPWVCASSGVSRSAADISVSAPTSPAARGSQTCCTAPLTMTAYERLLMSSLVHAKWTSSARPASAGSGARARSRFLRKYSTALTSCCVTRSVAASSSISAGPNVVTTSRSAACSAPVSRRTPGTTCCSVRWISHSTSTWTRARLSAGSDRWSTSGATTERYRPSRAPSAMGGVTSARDTAPLRPEAAPGAASVVLVMAPSSQRAGTGRGRARGRPVRPRGGGR